MNSSASAERQFVWGLGEVDDLLVRDRDATQSGTLDERLYVLQDSSSNVTSLVNPTGIVVERYRYSPHGTCDVLDGWSDPRSESAFQCEHLSTGRELDSATGLY